MLQFHQLLKFEQICFTCFGAIVYFPVLPKLLFITAQTVPYLGLRRRAGRGIMIGTLFLFFPLLWHDTILLNDDSSAVTHRSNARPRGRRERERDHLRFG